MQAVWIRNDLRFFDQTALIQGIKKSEEEKDKLLLFFYLDPLQLEEGTKSHDYFFSAVAHFYQTCCENNIPLLFLTGELVSAFEGLLQAFPKIDCIHYNVSQRGYGLQRDQKVAQFLKEKNKSFKGYTDHHLHGPNEISKGEGTPYKVFTPYYKQWQLRKKREPLPFELYRLQEVMIQDLQGKDLAGKQFFERLLKSRQESHQENMGEEKALERLALFCEEKIQRYAIDREFPRIDGTSQLSVYLSTGQLSIRSVFQQVNQLPESPGKETFIKELAWRDFYHMIYAFHPQQKELEVMEKYQGIPWNDNEEWFEKWKAGQTGFPIVDAGMRQLSATGWMHNRLRMITASFLTKDLGIDWRQGEAYFAQQLIDYDSASNIGGWQWSASVGTDAVPYFRVFNPTLQSQKFDATGRFIRQYVPELRSLPEYAIHEPYRFKQKLLAEGIDIRQIYPAPMVDHGHQRLQSIEKYKYFMKPAVESEE